MKKYLFATLAVLAVTNVPLANGAIIFFTDAAAFQAALGPAGKVSKGSVDFDNHEDLLPLPPDIIDAAILDDPLNIDNLQGTFLPGNFIDNLTFQSNMDGPGLSGPNPVGAGGLQLWNAGYGNIVESALINNVSSQSLDILSGPPAGGNHTALSLTLGSGVISGFKQYNISVFDKGGTLQDTLLNLPVPPATVGKAFLGILSTDATIGRVNIWEPGAGDGVWLFEATAYVPEPATISLLAFGALALLRRRR